jgi:HD-like signal output (HDOD) protein
MKRILFVDDEQRILDGLRRMLHSKSQGWDIAFAGGGEQALALMAEQPFDVVVTDMRMPGMDGAALLKRVQELYPQTVRIVLSGHSDMEAALQTIPISHQFLSKPCNAETIKEVVERACSLQDLLSIDSTRQLVGKFKTLPAMPKVHAELLKALADPDVDVASVAAIVEKDLGVTTRLLQVVNSGFFGLRRQLSSTHDAVSYLGLQMVKNLVLAMEVFNAFQGKQGLSSEALAIEQRHALRVANLAAKLVPAGPQADKAFVAGLLHDFGKLLLLLELPERCAAVHEQTSREGRPYHEVEQEHFGIGHAEVGAYLLGLWGVAYPIMEAVANHHWPERVPQTEFGLVAAVWVANELTREVSEGRESAALRAAALPGGYGEQFALAARLPAWRALAAEMVSELAEASV